MKTKSSLLKVGLSLTTGLLSLILLMAILATMGSVEAQPPNHPITQPPGPPVPQSPGPPVPQSLIYPVPRSPSGPQAPSAPPNVTISKAVYPDEVAVGMNVTYTIVLTNTGGPAYDVVITDVLPSGFEYVISSTVGVSEPTESCLGWGWNIGAVTSTGKIFSFQVKAADTEGDNYCNTVFAEASNTKIPWLVKVACVKVGTVDLDLIVSSSATETNNCESITYTIAVTNTGDISATNVVVTSAMPSGFEGSPYTDTVGTLAASGTWSATVVFTATCTAGSGENKTTVSYAEGTVPDQHNDITVKWGALVLRKEPPVIQAEVGETVVWTVTVENTGEGELKNVVVTDTLGSGLGGATVVNNYPSIAAGAVKTFTVSATVTSCKNLTNTATAIWGCDSDFPCQPLETAKASVQLEVKEPGLAVSILPSPINLNVCGPTPITVTLTNNGAGPAYNPRWHLYLPTDYTISNVSGVDSHSRSGSTAIFTPTNFLTAGHSVSFTFDLEPNCDASSAILPYKTFYEDACDNPFRFPVGYVSADVTQPDLNVNKTGPAAIYKGMTGTYTITVIYSGPACTSTVRVTDAIPSDFEYASSSPAGVHDSGVVTWAGVQVPFTATITLTATGTAGLEGTNRVTATMLVSDCLVSASGSARMSIVSASGPDGPGPGGCMIRADKSASPIPAEPCKDTIHYLNEYEFDSASMTDWSKITVCEQLLYQDYVTNSVVLTATNTVSSCRVTLGNGTAVGDYRCWNLADVSTTATCPITPGNAAVTVTYNLVFTDTDQLGDLGPNGEWERFSFLDWTKLTISGTSGCDGDHWQAAEPAMLRPALWLDEEAPVFWESCAGNTVVFTITNQYPTSSQAYSATLAISMTSFMTIETTSVDYVVSGSPDYITGTVGDQFVYTFTNPLTGSVRVTTILTKDCSTDLKELVHLDYYGSCNEGYWTSLERLDSLNRRRTWNEGSNTRNESAPGFVKSATLILRKTPELYFATSSEAVWHLSLTNSGDGKAYNTVVTDTLGADLRLADCYTDTGVTTSTQGVTWTISSLDVGDAREMVVTATVVGCTDLDNDAGAWSCGDGHCWPVSDHSRAEIPSPNLSVRNATVTPMPVCATETVTITVKNVGLVDVSVNRITETLPGRLTYVTNTTEYSPTGSTSWESGGNPTTGGSNLIWTSSEITPLQSVLHPGDVVLIRFDVEVGCTFDDDDLEVEAEYQDSVGCGTYTTTHSFNLTAREPDLSIIKKGRNLSTGSSWSGVSVIATPTQQIEWVITVTNGSGAAPIKQLWLTDTLPSNMMSTTVTFTHAATQTDHVLVWDVGALGAGASETYHITGTVEADTCDRQKNVAKAAWYCDGVYCDSETADVMLYSRPDIVPTKKPGTMHQCGEVFTITLNNRGTVADDVVLTDTLPAGLVYSATVYSNTAPATQPVPGSAVPTWTWGALLHGVTTIAFEVRNAALAGECVSVPDRQNVITTTYTGECTWETYVATDTKDIDIQSPNLKVNKTPFFRTVSTGEIIVWNLQVVNQGDGVAYNVLITDVVGAGFGSVFASHGGTVAGNTVTWAPVDLAPCAAEVWQATVTATVGTVSGYLTNTLAAAGYCETGCEYDRDASTVRVSAMGGLSKTLESTTYAHGEDVRIGDLVTFTVTANFWGSYTYTNVIITDTLPTGLGYITSTCTADGDTYTPILSPTVGNWGKIAWNIDDSPGNPGQDGDLQGPKWVIITVTAVVNDVGSNTNGKTLINKARVTWTDNGQDYEEEDTASVYVKEPSLDISKDVASSTGSTSDLDGMAILTYTITLVNSGTSPAYDVVITDAVPSGVSVTAQYGGDASSGPVQGTDVLTWYISTISNATGFDTVVVSYTARLSGAVASGNVAAETIYLTNRVSATYSSLPGDPPPGEERDYGPINDTATVDTASANVKKSVAPASGSTNNLRIGDVVTYTIVDEVPPGLIIPWPYQYDYLPAGFRYVTGTFAVDTNLPVAGSSLTDTLSSPFASGTYLNQDRGVLGLSATTNPNIGPHYNNNTRQDVEWWFQTLNNADRDTTGLVTITFQAQIVGVNLQGNPTWTDQLASAYARNYAYLLWNTEDTEAYTYTVPVNEVDSWAASRVGQPHLTIDKDSDPSPGSYVGKGERITYTLTITNDGHTPAYDIVVSDTLPSGLTYVASGVTSTKPPTIAFDHVPTVGATGVITWRVNELWGSDLNGGTAVITVVAQVTDTIGASLELINTAAIPYYDSQYDNGPDVGLTPTQRTYTGNDDSVSHYTVDAEIHKSVTFNPPPSATLGTLVTYTLTVPKQPITATLYDVMVTDTVDSRLYIEDVTTAGGTGDSSGWNVHVVTATFDSITHGTQAYVTITARIKDSLGADDGDTIPDTARMSHRDAPATDSNQVSTLVNEPKVAVDKSVASSTGIPADGLALLTYTIRLTNNGNSPAYSLHITDAVPSGISVTALYGGDARSGPVVGQGVLTWTVDYISNTTGANTVELTYTARISKALSNHTLDNTVDVLYHSLTETIPGVRPYTESDSASVETASPTIAKNTDQPTLRVGDLVTYHLVFTIPAGTVGMGGNSYLADTLPQGVWYITDTENLDWTPPGVYVTWTQRVSGTLNGSQVITWTFGEPITSLQNTPTVITLTFCAQAVGVPIDGSSEVWADGETITNTMALWQRSVFEGNDDVNNEIIQPHLTFNKDSDPPNGYYVGKLDLITYTLTITNSGSAPAYDIVVSDTLPPPDLTTYVTSAIASATPPTITFDYTPTVGATGLITWRVNELWGSDLSGGTAVITVVVQVTDTIGFKMALVNTAAITYYDSQPQDGPGPYTPGEREYSDGSASVMHRTVKPYADKAPEYITATIGDEVIFKIAGPEITATVYSVVATDTVDGRLRVDGCRATGTDNPACSKSGQVVTGTWDSIPGIPPPPAPKSVLYITNTLTDSLGMKAGDTITNAADFQWAQSPGGIPEYFKTNIVTVTVAEPKITLDKSVQIPPLHAPVVGAGDIVTYTIVMTNEGESPPWPAYDVVVTDTLPPGVTFVETKDIVVTDPTTAITTCHNLCGSSTMTWYVSPLNVDGRIYITFTAQVSYAIGARLTLTNAVKEGRYDTQPDTPDIERVYEMPTDTATIQTGQPDLDLTKTAWPTTAIAGMPLTYTLTVTNVGIVSATGVFITDVIPVNTTFFTATTPITVPDTGAGNIVTWSLGILDISAPRVVTMVVHVPSSVPTGTIITNTAWVTCAEGLTDTDTITTLVNTLADLAVLKSDDPDPVPAETSLVYTLHYVNNGPSDARNVYITDTLPGNVTYDGAASAMPTFQGPTVTVGPPFQLTWYTPTLVDEASGTIVFTVTAHITTTDPFTNTVVITSTTPDPIPDNNRDVEPTEFVKPIGGVTMPFVVTTLVVQVGLAALAGLLLAGGMVVVRRKRRR